MAKRTSNRSQADDAATATPAQPKSRRARGAGAPEPDTLGAFPDVERSEDDDAALNAASRDEQPQSNPTRSEERGSSSMQSEPSEEDIRMRAYQRFLDRGGQPGMDFEDWVEAERELKSGR